MACTSRYKPWPREWIEAVHRGRELVDGKPRKTYQQIADELGTTKAKVTKAAARYGASRTDGRSRASRKFTDSQEAEIARLIEDGVLMRRMGCKGLQKLLAAHGYSMCENRIYPRVRKIGGMVWREYETNIASIRGMNGALASRRRAARNKRNKGVDGGKDARSKSEGQDKSNTEKV